MGPQEDITLCIVIALLGYFIRQTVEWRARCQALRAEVEKLRPSVYKDGLTGLFNRAFLQHELTRMFNSSRFPVTIVMLDINHFKPINDSYGHLVGDQILVHVARSLIRTVRADDYVVRYGGDEFLIYLTNAMSEHELEMLGQRICQELRNSCQLPEPHGPATISCGYATQDGVQSLKDLIDVADRRMYQNKFASKNRSRYSTPN